MDLGNQEAKQIS